MRPSLANSTLLFAALVSLALTGLSTWQIRSSREAQMRAARTETANLAGSLAQQAQAVIESVDVALRGMQERFAHDGIGPEAIPRWDAWMRARVHPPSRLSHLNTLFVFDSNGHWVASSLPDVDRNLNFADRAYFKYHRDHNDDSVLVGDPVRSKVDDRWIVTVTRRLNDPEGRFAGVADASMTLGEFQALYETVDVGRNGVITLATRSGTILVRQPLDEANIGRSVADNALFRDILNTVDSQTIELASPVDGKMRLVSYHRIQGFDLLIIVGRDMDDVLAPWRQQTKIHLILLAVTLCVANGLALHLTRQIHSREEAEDLYRLLAENASDAIVCTDLDGNRRYASPAYEVMTGRSAEDLADKPWTALVLPEDHAIFKAAMAELVAGTEIVTITYRYRKPDGSVVWVELRGRMTNGTRRRPPEFIANMRDISRQKAVEYELAKANAELSALTMTDSLTGVANRRKFDQTLATEWKRGFRDGTILAILMVDADNFKQYNDLYGHARGDECLRRIAAILYGGARRPADLAARYGGEEFALILPVTSAPDAVEIGLRICQAVAASNMEHDGNEGGRVTVSIGVAALIPGPDASPQQLVEAADQALYEAKKLGRNCVVQYKPPGSPAETMTQDAPREIAY
jgi:diguanylate cyclase (GGDEF)-like protein/PAS domain S-box-containing protein